MKALLGLIVMGLLVGCETAPREVLPYVMRGAGPNGGEASLDLHLYDLEMGQSRSLVQTASHHEYDPDLDAAGKRVAYIAQSAADSPVAASYTLKTYDLETGLIQDVLQSKTLLRSPVWSNNGEKIAYVVQREGKLQIDIFEPGTDKPAKTVGFGSEPSWRSDDRALFYNSCDTTEAKVGNLMVHELKSGLNQSLSLRGNGFRNLQRGTSILYTTQPYSRRNEAVWLIDANSRQTRLSSPGKTHRDLDPVHINGTKFVAFTRIDVNTSKPAIFVVERYAEKPVETQLIKTKGDAYTRGGEQLD